MATQPILARHVRRRRASFVLTSLIDVIFLLVIFFMVSSQIVPFSVIGLGPISNAPADGDTAPAIAPTDEAPPVALRVMAGSVRMAGETVTLGEIAPALDRLKAQGVTALLLIPTGAATVQDIVSVLEAVKAAAIGTVTVLNGKGPRQ